MKNLMDSKQKKYDLFIPNSFWSHDDSTLVLIVNGCGPRGFGSKIVPDRIWGLSIKPACIIHDFMYETGTTKNDKDQADIWFLQNMLKIIKKDSNLIMRLIRRRAALLYYQAVSEFGDKAFNNKTLNTRK